MSRSCDRTTREQRIVEQLARPLPASVIAKMLGVPGTDFPRFKAWGEDVVMLLGAPVGTVAIVEGAHRAVVGLKAFMRDAIAERRRRPSDDMLSLLIHAEDQGQVLDEEELVATSAFILLAGYETTTHLISNGLLALLEHPDQLRRLRDQPELVRRDDQCQVPEIIVCLNSAAPTVGQNRSMGVVAPDSRHPGISPQLVASVVVSEALQGMM